MMERALVLPTESQTGLRGGRVPSQLNFSPSLSKLSVNIFEMSRAPFQETSYPYQHRQDGVIEYADLAALR